MLTKSEIEFIKSNINSDINKLALNKSNHPKNIRSEIVLHQIKLLNKITSKLPFLSNNCLFLFPKNISVEQASSEATANYKATIVDYEISADLTGGMGIDSLFFSKYSTTHYYNEIAAELCDIFKYNTEVLNIHNISISNLSALDFIQNISNKSIDLIYLDPARRDIKGAKTYFLEDTIPNPLEIISAIKSLNLITLPKVLIKTSPLLDISRATSQLKYVEQVHVISVDNECKELLFLLDLSNNGTQIIQYFAINIKSDSSQKFISNNKAEKEIIYSNPQKYLYEPNSSLMKLGFWAEIAEQFELNKISPNSHLFTSDSLIPDFPGRIFSIIDVVKIDKKLIHTYLPEGKANISVRNFKMSVAEIKKKYKIADGGNIYIFFTTLNDKSNRAIICQKPKQCD